MEKRPVPRIFYYLDGLGLLCLFAGRFLLDEPWRSILQWLGIFGVLAAIVVFIGALRKKPRDQAPKDQS
jgi:hypothetical protein